MKEGRGACYKISPFKYSINLLILERLVVLNDLISQFYETNFIMPLQKN